jgi:hypothetical protein
MNLRVRSHDQRPELGIRSTMVRLDRIGVAGIIDSGFWLGSRSC